MTERLSPGQLEELMFCMKGDRLAIKLCLDLLFAGHLWDDLIDRDRDRTPDDINQAFRVALGDIPTNPFYQTYQLQLAPLMMSASILWLDSTKLEKGNLNDRMAAFIMRNALANIVHYVMFVVGGLDWIEEHGARLWQIFNLHEKWLEFIEE